MMIWVAIFGYLLAGALTIRLCDWLDRKYNADLKAGSETLMIWHVMLATVVLRAASGRLSRSSGT